jgi:hypothetical protein
MVDHAALAKLSVAARKFCTRRAPWKRASPAMACRSTPSWSLTYAGEARVNVAGPVPVKGTKDKVRGATN